MRLSLAAILFVVALTGCIPVKQFDITGGAQYDHLIFEDQSGLLQIGPSNVPKSFKLIDRESFAISPSGEHFGIESEPHTYDLGEDGKPRFTYIRDDIYLVDQKGKRVNRDWADGSWKFHFAMDTPSGPDFRDFDVRFWTLYYNPLIHGPPN